MEELAAFDAPAFGASRLSVLARHFAEYPERCLVARDQTGALTGFLLARPNTLGPWHATNQEDAEKLLQMALAVPASTFIRISIPAQNTAALSLLTRYGSVVQDTLAHMRWGKPLERDLEGRLYGMASLMLG